MDHRFRERGRPHERLGLGTTNGRIIAVIAFLFVAIIVYVLFFGISGPEIEEAGDPRLVDCLLSNGSVSQITQRFRVAERYIQITSSENSKRRFILYTPIGGWGHQIIALASLFELSLLTKRRLVVDIPYYAFFFRSPFGFPINADNVDIFHPEQKKLIEITSDKNFADVENTFASIKDFATAFPEKILHIKSSRSLESALHRNSAQKDRLESILGVPLQDRTAISHIIQLFTSRSTDLLLDEVNGFKDTAKWEGFPIKIGVHMTWKQGKDKKSTLSQHQFEGYIGEIKKGIGNIKKMEGIEGEMLIFLSSDVREQKIHLKTYLSTTGKCVLRETKEVNTEKETDPYKVLQPLADWYLLGEVDYLFHMGSPFASSAGMRGNVATFQYDLEDNKATKVPMDKYKL